ncbi:MAG: hypothetical protein GF418_17475, partial [Chitinivibrionales bacterium]|nr:hypothetical protein [Chitinivibrionales bacterium]MBD3397412.1 hypothetical protein [Chitinivibrionales bacterium]
MKPRRWIILLGISLLLTGFALYQGVRVLEKNRNVERILVERISEQLGGTFDVERARLGLFSVYLSNVEVSLPLHTFRLYVKDIKVGLSFLKLLVTRGDVGASINKIIFVEPRIDVAYQASGAAASDTGTAPAPPGGDAWDGLPLDRLLIRRGIVQLTDRRGAHVLTATGLDGTVWQDHAAMHFELKGKLGAMLRNLTLSGALSREGGRHRVSFRLRRARIRQPVNWRSVSFTGGVLDGVGEFSFDGAFALERMESHGWLAIEDATAAMAGISEPIEHFDLRLNFADTRVSLDSLRSIWRGARLKAGGIWDFAYADSSVVRVRCDNIVPSQVFPAAPPVVAENVLGRGWLEATVGRRRGTGEVEAGFDAGGISVWGNAVTRCAGSIHFEGRVAVLDSLAVEGAEYALRAGGMANFEERPVAYEVSARFSGAAQDFFPALRGDIAFSGSVRGLGSEPRVQCTFRGDSMTCMGIALGDPSISMQGTGTSLSFGSDKANRAYFTLSGRVDSLDREHPAVHAGLRLENASVLPAIRNLPYGLGESADSAWASLTVSGTATDLAADGTVELRGRKVGGALILAAGVKDSLISWRVVDRGLTVARKRFPLVAAGTLFSDSLVIDTIRVIHGGVGKGRIRFGAPANLSMELACAAVPLADLDAWFLNGQEVLRAGRMSASIRMYGPADKLETRAHVHVRDCNLAGVRELQADAIVASSGREYSVLPFVVRKGKKIVLTVDTLSSAGGLTLAGEFSQVELDELLGSELPEDYRISGLVSGEFMSSDSGLPVRITASADRVRLNEFFADSLSMVMRAGRRGLAVDTLSARDSTRTAAAATAFV